MFCKSCQRQFPVNKSATVMPFPHFFSPFGFQKKREKNTRWDESQHHSFQCLYGENKWNASVCECSSPSSKPRPLKITHFSACGAPQRSNPSLFSLSPVCLLAVAVSACLVIRLASVWPCLWELPTTTWHSPPKSPFPPTSSAWARPTLRSGTTSRWPSWTVTREATSPPNARSTAASWWSRNPSRFLRTWDLSGDEA